MAIDFDEAKDAINVAKHGVSLAFGAGIFDDPDHVVIGSHRPVDGEDRFKVIGSVAGRLWTGVHVHRGEVVRYVSVRRSNDVERRAYHRHSG